MDKANHELYRKNLRLMKENEKLRKKAEHLKEENEKLFSQLMKKLSNGGANNPNSNAPNNMLDLTLRLGPSQNAYNSNN
ncbi:hypothetical protein L195_g053403 [Trifolium pratense]|uniref:Uncharacterized protein n=1 Tax=Trifolium pratense TaxID=57577 RepID=A0A2K3KAC6_TRIPR|nr:hypothetical protein L195_g053403 [Trifolium pratense]